MSAIGTIKILPHELREAFKSYNHYTPRERAVLTKRDRIDGSRKLYATQRTLARLSRKAKWFRELAEGKRESNPVEFQKRFEELLALSLHLAALLLFTDAEFATFGLGGWSGWGKPTTLSVPRYQAFVSGLPFLELAVKLQLAVAEGLRHLEPDYAARVNRIHASKPTQEILKVVRSIGHGWNYGPRPYYQTCIEAAKAHRGLKREKEANSWRGPS